MNYELILRATTMENTEAANESEKRIANLQRSIDFLSSSQSLPLTVGGKDRTAALIQALQDAIAREKAAQGAILGRSD